jgi:hypothetical protein
MMKVGCEEKESERGRKREGEIKQRRRHRK